LLIIDEIEEADSNAIDALLKLSLAKDKTGQTSILKRSMVEFLYESHDETFF
jgi:hypothetical protein